MTTTADIDNELPDDDPEVIAGMKRLAELREREDYIAEFPPVARPE